jgi:hypothetical protein
MLRGDDFLTSSQPPIFLSKKKEVDLMLRGLKFKMDLVHYDGVMIVEGGYVDKEREE